MKKIIFTALITVLLYTNSNSQDIVTIENDLQLIWDNLKGGYENDIETKLAIDKNTESLYNLSYETINLLVYTHNTKNYAVMDELIRLYVLALDKTVNKNSNKRDNCFMTFDRSWPMWVTSENEESLLNSCIFLSTVSKAILYATQIPESERDTNTKILLTEPYLKR
ncbi:hypothetical protein [Aquimarina aggregata]|uniref:hypothetical protein n=1 Tax=Aquimarina aggregata TaxID=1642818 RepID=UPI002492AB73|nr:hypothetical protein [Aquimarina aggregata]